MYLDDSIWLTCSTFGTPLSELCKEESDVIDSLIHRQKLEKIFCNDFICCGQYWTDLHNLLQHCEDCHADDGDDAIMIEADGDDLELDEKELSAMTTYNCAENGKQIQKRDDHGIDDSLGDDNGGYDDENDDDEDDDDDEKLLTPLSPLASGINSPFFLPQHITSDDLTALENSQRPSSMIRPCETQEEYGYEKIKEWMHQAQAMRGIEEQVDDSHKPYRCQVPGCDKAYKNSNGLKYHKVHGHCRHKEEEASEESLQKPYLCSLGRCRKRYKNLNGLKYHIQHGHFKYRKSSPSSSSVSFLPSYL